MFRPDVLQKCYNIMEVNVLNMFNIRHEQITIKNTYL